MPDRLEKSTQQMAPSRLTCEGGAGDEAAAKLHGRIASVPKPRRQPPTTSASVPQDPIYHLGPSRSLPGPWTTRLGQPEPRRWAPAACLSNLVPLPLGPTFGLPCNPISLRAPCSMTVQESYGPVLAPYGSVGGATRISTNPLAPAFHLN